jgi:hypothetical protein
MATFTSYSQCGQDMFAYSMCGTDNGTFLDIGAKYPVKSNNSYGLECKGWSGLTIDCAAEFAAQYTGVRKAPLIVLDMTSIDWSEFIHRHPVLQGTVDYLSFDIDEASLTVLRKFPFDRLGFRAMTVEHDVYNRGKAARTEMRSILKHAGYEAIATDVMVTIMWEGRPQAVPFEDWYVRPERVDMGIANRFRCDAKLWNEVLTGGLSDEENRWVPV